MLATLRNTPIIEGEPTGIPRLEGFEWATLQEYNFYKSRSHVRLAGKAVDPKSYLYDLQQKELHDAAKAGIRAAMGRLAAHPEGNRLLFITRDLYQSASGCLTGTENPSSPRPPLELFPTACDSFEAHIASAAVRSLRDNLGIFTPADVALIYQFYRVKADAPCAATACQTQITGEAAMTAFVASTLRFIQSVAGATKSVYDATLAGGRDERAALRLLNAERAELKRAAAAGSARRTIEDRVLNANDLDLLSPLLDMYSSAAPSPVLPWVSYAVPRVQPFSDTIVDIRRDANGQPIRDGRGRFEKVFTPDVPATSTTSVSFVLNPRNTVRECDKTDNVIGFFTYALDPANPVPLPGLPDYPQSPVQFPAPPPECTSQAVPAVAVTKLVNQQPHIKVAADTTVTITHRLSNTGLVAIDGVVVADLLTERTYGPFALAPGQSHTVTDTFRPRVFGKELIGPSEVLAFAPGGRTATAWDSVGIDVVRAPCPVLIAPLDADPNPYAENGAAVSTVMEGGSAYRHYRVVGVAGPGVVTFSINGRPFTAVFDAEGYLTHPPRPGDEETPADELRGLEITAAHIGAPGTYPVKFEAVNGSPSVCSQPFFIEVTPREFTRGYTAGAAIEAAATAAVGLAGKAGLGFGVSIDEKVEGPRTKLSFNRSINGAFGGQIGISSPKLKGTVPGLRGQIGASAQGTLLGTLMMGDTHDFAYAPGTAQLTPGDSRALGGLLLGTMAVANYNNPMLHALLSSVADVTNYDNYQSGFNVALGIDASAGVDGGAIAGLQASDRSRNADFSTLKFGVGGGVSGSVGRSVNFGVDTGKFREAELVPSFSAKFSADAGGSIGIGDISQELDEESKEKVLDIKNKFKASFKGVINESWKVKLALDSARDYRPKRLTLSFASQKGFGWGAAGKTYRAIAVSGDPEKVTYTYTVADPQVIGQLVNHLSSIQELSRLVAGGALTGAGVFLGPTLLDQELLHLWEILAKADAETEVAGEKRATASSFPSASTSAPGRASRRRPASRSTAR